MEQKRNKIGIIGMGRMGITHFSIINSRLDINIVSVADSSKMTLSIIKKYIPEIQVYTDYKLMIDETKPDAIIVCTPPNYHYTIIKYAFQNGIHVFVEKPFTSNRKEAEELSDLFSNSPLINQVGYVIRYNDVFQKVSSLLNKDVIGKIVHFRAEMLSCAIIGNNEGNGWRSTRENGGGATYESAAHAIDMVNYLIGPPDKISGTTMTSLFSKNVEDIVTSTFIYKNGIVGSLYVNWSDESYRKPTLKLEIFGSKGKILADMFGCKIFLKKENIECNYRKGWNTIYITDVFKPVEFYVRGNEFTRQLYLFADLLSGKSHVNMCTFRDALNTQIVIEDMFKDSNLNSQF